jgi:NifB/MoaA-like Fe-S oxidoreductase
MHREGLTELKRFDAVSAGAMLDMVHSCQKRFLKELGTRFVFPSDEFYCICHQQLPEESEYEDYPQIENGVGMLRLLDQECRDAAEYLLSDNIPKKPSGRRIVIPTGVSARPFIQALVNRYAPEGADIQVIAVKNTFFGETITVTGLIVGCDLIKALQGIKCDEILICDTMLRENTDRFLDDMTLEDVCNALGCPVKVIPNNGESLIRALWKLEDENV